MSNDVAEGRDAHSQSPGPSHNQVAKEPSSLSRPRRRNYDEVPIYTDEPVPRDSQAYWNTILADAGTTARVHQTSLARSPQIIVPSDSWLENNGSLRLSIRDTNEEDPITTSCDGDLISPRSPDSDRESAASTEIFPRLSSLSLPSLDGDQDWQQNQSHRSSIESLHLQSSRKWNTGVDAEASDQLPKPLNESGMDSQHTWASQADVDGPSDAAPTLRHISSISTLQDQDPGSVGMPFGAQARKAELAASRTAGSFTGSPLYRPESGITEWYDRDSYGQAYNRTRSGGVPRSRLYISEAAASSSPVGHERFTSAWDYETAIDQGDIHYSPPRSRRRPYRRRSETYSFVASEESTHHTLTPEAASTTLASTNPFGPSPYDRSSLRLNEFRDSPTTREGYATGSLPPSTPRRAQDYASSLRMRHQHPVMSPYYSPNLTQSRNNSSTHSNGMSPQSHDGSFGLPYIADTNARDSSTFPRRILGSLPLPASPASRIPSFSSNIISRDENNHFPSGSYRPNTPPLPPSPIESTFRTPTRIPIYDDSLPAYSQPQTAVGLPRHGLPRTSRNPYFTAPARNGSGFRRGAADWVQTAFGTPTRASRRHGRDSGMLGRDVDQENVSTEVEAERSARRSREDERRELRLRRRAWREGRRDWGSDLEGE